MRREEEHMVRRVLEAEIIGGKEGEAGRTQHGKTRAGET